MHSENPCSPGLKSGRSGRGRKPVASMENWKLLLTDVDVASNAAGISSTFVKYGIRSTGSESS